MTRTTRVKVSRKTLQILNRLKDETGLKSHDEVIRELVSERKKLPRSMFGSDPIQGHGVLVNSKKPALIRTNVP